MTNFQIHTAETAPAESAKILERAQKGLGFVPNLYATMAESPALLKGYTTLASLLDGGSFTPTEVQIVLMTNNYLNNCEYCQAAHTTISQGTGVPEDVIQALRNNTPIADVKLEALRQFAAVVNETRGWPAQADLDAFFAAGYTQQSVLEVVLGTAVKVMSNYTNHVAQTPVDPAFAKNAWSKNSLPEAV